MQNCGTTLAALAIIFITHSAADLNPRLYVFAEFGYAITNHLRKSYQSSSQARTIPGVKDELESQRQLVSENAKNILHEYERRFDTAESGGKDIANCRTSLISTVNDAEDAALVALEGCTVKTKLDTESFDSKFRTLLTMGADLQDKIRKTNEMCNAEPEFSRENCIDLKILETDQALMNYRIESMKFRKRLSNSITSATIAVHACFMEPLGIFAIASANIRQNTESVADVLNFEKELSHAIDTTVASMINGYSNTLNHFYNDVSEARQNCEN